MTWHVSPLRRGQAGGRGEAQAAFEERLHAPKGRLRAAEHSPEWYAELERLKASGMTHVQAWDEMRRREVAS